MVFPIFIFIFFFALRKSLFFKFCFFFTFAGLEGKEKNHKKTKKKRRQSLKKNSKILKKRLQVKNSKNFFHYFSKIIHKKIKKIIYVFLK
mgnify:CR=1 FL=1